MYPRAYGWGALSALLRAARTLRVVARGRCVQRGFRRWWVHALAGRRERHPASRDSMPGMFRGDVLEGGRSLQGRCRMRDLLQVSHRLSARRGRKSGARLRRRVPAGDDVDRLRRGPRPRGVSPLRRRPELLRVWRCNQLAPNPEPAVRTAGHIRQVHGVLGRQVLRHVGRLRSQSRGLRHCRLRGRLQPGNGAGPVPRRLLRAAPERGIRLHQRLCVFQPVLPG